MPEYILSEDHTERVEFIRRKKLELELVVASQTKANHWISREIVFEETKLWEEIGKEHNLEGDHHYIVVKNRLIEKEEP